MKKAGRKIGIGLFFILIFLSSHFAQKGETAFSLSVTPYEGGYDLRFGRITPELVRVNKEVIVNIFSDIAKPYRVTQTLLEPLSTTEGNTIPVGNFTVYGLRGTNKYGTLNVEQEFPVTLNRQIIYTSNQTGAADSFTLVYSLMANPDIAPGYYRGRIGFTLEPINAEQSPVTVILNISVEFKADAAIEIKTSAGKGIFLNPADPQSSVSAVEFKIKGGFGKQFRISQVLSDQPISSEGNLLDWEAINFLGQGAQKGIVVNNPVALSAQPQIIYTSSPRGEPDDFVILYRLGDLSRQKAGNYRTKIKYILEGISFAQTRLIETLDLQVENPRVFELLVTPETGGLIQFRDIKPSQAPKTQEIIIQVKTNIARAYQVNQNTASLLTNKEGKVIPSRYFFLRQESLDTKGVLKHIDKTEIKEGQMVLFVSDQKGSADKFKVIYELIPASDLQPGDYSTVFTYSVSEI